jgi:hypothetical protein
MKTEEMANVENGIVSGNISGGRVMKNNENRNGVAAQ